MTDIGYYLPTYHNANVTYWYHFGKFVTDKTWKIDKSKLKEAFPSASAAAPPAGDSSAENAPKQADVNVYIGQAVSSLQNNDQVYSVPHAIAPPSHSLF